MTEEEIKASLAYMKLHDDVRNLIVETVLKEIVNPSNAICTQLQANIIYSQSFRDQVKNVVRDQMNKY